jgi:hypothetical protein
MVSRITPENYFSMENAGGVDQNIIYSIIVLGIVVCCVVFSGTLIYALSKKP